MMALSTDLPGVILLQPRVFRDTRGWFMESFNERVLRDLLGSMGLPAPRPFVQQNHSCSMRGVLRGLHAQRAPHTQGKLVRVVKGAVFDVALDVRPDSATFGRWAGAELSAENHHQIWIPEGFAHGFVALQDDTHLLYQTTDYWAPQSELTIAWDDPDLAIDWPVLDQPVQTSAKDGAARGWAQVRRELATAADTAATAAYADRMLRCGPAHAHVTVGV